jgi:hypothetical protein
MLFLLRILEVPAVLTTRIKIPVDQGCMQCPLKLYTMTAFYIRNAGVLIVPQSLQHGCLCSPTECAASPGGAPCSRLSEPAPTTAILDRCPPTSRQPRFRKPTYPRASSLSP